MLSGRARRKGANSNFTEREEMTDLQKVFGDIVRSSVGMERFMDAHKQIADVASKMNSHFPAYNIKKLSENKYEVELAIAGYTIGDVSIELDKNVLSIRSEKQDLGALADSFIYKGFTYKGFNRSFTLEDNVRVEDAELVNGLLKIYLERLVPEAQKAKKVNIRQPGTSEKKILNEDML